MSRRYCLTLDLKDDPKSIAEYKRHHERIWPEITASLKKSGIENAEIYLLGTRLFMILEVNDEFSFEAKALSDQANPKVREWEELMWKYQSPMLQAKAREKWLLMEKRFQLEK
jgi:L-rhamnose mutarotase